MSLNESIAEDASLEWFRELGYTFGHEPHLAPCESAVESDLYGCLMQFNLILFKIFHHLKN
jgi:hypothetical protein